MPINVTVRDLQPGGATWQAQLPEPLATIGRNATCDLVLQDPDKHVSRLHATLELRDGAYYLTAKSKINPIMLDGAICQPDSAMLLRDGACITMHPFELTARFGAAPGRPMSAAPVEADAFAWLNAPQPAAASVPVADPFGLNYLQAKPAAQAAVAQADPFQIAPGRQAPSGLVPGLFEPAPGLSPGPAPSLDPLQLLAGAAGSATHRSVGIGGPASSAVSLDDILGSGPALHGGGGAPLVDLGGQLGQRASSALDHVHDFNLPFHAPRLDPAPSPVVAAPAPAAVAPADINLDWLDALVPRRPADLAAAPVRQADPFAAPPAQSGLLAGLERQADPFAAPPAQTGLLAGLERQVDPFAAPPAQTGLLAGLERQVDPFAAPPPQTGLLGGLERQTDPFSALPAQSGLLAGLERQADPFAAPPAQSGLLAGLERQTDPFAVPPAQSGLFAGLERPADPFAAPPQTGLLAGLEQQADPYSIPPSSAPAGVAFVAPPPAGADGAAARAIGAPAPVDGTAVSAFARGLGDASLKVGSAREAEFFEAAGEIVEVAVRGLHALLLARAEIKKELRAEERTMLAAQANNPLKFMGSPREALRFLFDPAAASAGAFLSPVQAIKDACDELLAHELGMVAGMRGAVIGAVKRFDPEVVERQAGKVGGLMQLNRKAKLWDAYVEQYGKLQHDMADNLDRLFERDFLDAYTEQVRRIKKDS